MRWMATALLIITALIIAFNYQAQPSDDKQVIVSHNEIADACRYDNNEQGCLEYPYSSNSEENDQQALALASIDAQSISRWKLSTPLQTQLAQLEQLSANGDVQATYILAKNLRYCFYTPSNEESYQERVSEALNNDEGDTYLSNLEELFQYCQNVTHATKKQFARYLTLAANQGHIEAMIDYGFANTELLVKVESETLSTLDARVAVLAAQQEYLTTAAQQGHLKAISRLSDNLWQQKFGNNDGIQALAYLYLFLELTDDNQLYSRYQWQEQRILKQLSSEKVAQARELSKELLSNIQNKLIQSELNAP